MFAKNAQKFDAMPPCAANPTPQTALSLFIFGNFNLGSDFSLRSREIVWISRFWEIIVGKTPNSSHRTLSFSCHYMTKTVY